MAGIMHKTSRLMAAVLLGCLLAGCGGQLLSHREIVRAVFFTAQDAGYTVTLLTSDQQSEDSAACKTFTGSGATCAAAWNAAAQTMNGQPFYGLMDLAVLPAGCSWPLAEEIAQLLQSTARPAPEIAVFVLDPAVQMPIQDQTPTLYENLKALEEKQQLHCGLQTLLGNAEPAAVPVSAGGEYAMLFYDTAANTARQTQSTLAAQLVAILCGQAHRLDCTLPDDLHLAAKAFLGGILLQKIIVFVAAVQKQNRVGALAQPVQPLALCGAAVPHKAEIPQHHHGVLFAQPAQLALLEALDIAVGIPCKIYHSCPPCRSERTV